MYRLESIKVYATHHESAHEPVKSDVWTISEDPHSEGWETDSGCSGYGLDKDKAEYYAKCINEHATLLQRLEIAKKALESVVNVIHVQGENRDIGEQSQWDEALVYKVKEALDQLKE